MSDQDLAAGRAPAPGATGRAPSRSTTVLWLARHGESEWNQQGLVQGQADAPGLSAAGQAQAAALAESLATTGCSWLLSSDLARAVETAAAVAERTGLALHTDPRLRERCLGAAEGTSILEAAGSLGIAGDQVVDADAAPERGETVRALYRRVVDWLAELACQPPAAEVAAVTHGGVVRVALAFAAGEPPDAMQWRPVPNGALFRVELGRGDTA